MTGFSEEFISRVTGNVEAVADNLLRSEGWVNFPADIEFTHAELEAEVNLDELAHEFERWLDEYLNNIDPRRERGSQR